MKKLILSLLVLAASFSCHNYNTTSPSKGTPDNVDVYLKEIRDTIIVPYNVFVPDNCSFMMVEYIDVEKGYNVLDIGTGSGIQGIIAAKKGAKRVVATEINPYALDAAGNNAERLGLANKFDFRLVTSKTGTEAFSAIRTDELFSLILFNAPWSDGIPGQIADFAYFDPGYRLIKSFFRGVGDHLTEKGKALLVFDSDEEKMAMLENLASSNNVDMVILDINHNINDIKCVLLEIKKIF